jgi:phage gpG-like protein
MAPPVRGLRLDVDLQFAFRPSLGISARRLDRLGLDIRSMREPLKRSIQQVLAPSFKKNFEVGGRPVPWEPLADFTVEQRGNADPVLVRSGLLKRTIQQLNIWHIDMHKAALLDLPPKIWYGKLQQAGRDDQNLPPRPFVVMQDDDYDGIERVFAVWLAERIAMSRAYRIGSQGR